MTFEQQIDDLVSKGNYSEVKRLVNAPFCTVAIRNQGTELVKKAASNRMAIIETRAREVDPDKFAAVVKELVDLAEDYVFPFRAEVGQLAVTLYSECMLVDQIRSLSENGKVPKSVAETARQELTVCRIDTKFSGNRSEAGTPQTPKAAMRKC